MEGPVCDLGPEVFGHLEAVLDPADFLGDLGRRQGRAGPSGHLAGDSGQRLLGGCQQSLPLLPPMLGQQRVVADDEPLARIVRAADFGQMTLVEQGELNRTSNANLPPNDRNGSVKY